MPISVGPPPCQVKGLILEEAVDSADTAAVTNVNDAPTGAVSIDTTTPAEGDTLTASNTLADEDGLGTITYQWLRDGALTGDTGTTYTTGQIDVDSVISVRASYTDGQGTAEAVDSADTAAFLLLHHSLNNRGTYT